MKTERVIVKIEGYIVKEFNIDDYTKQEIEEKIQDDISELEKGNFENVYIDEFHGHVKVLKDVDLKVDTTYTIVAKPTPSYGINPKKKLVKKIAKKKK